MASVPQTGKSREHRDELQRTLRLIEDCLYHQEMAETTRLTLQASADGIRCQILEAFA